MGKVQYMRNIKKVKQLSESEQKTLAPVTDKFAFRANSYYLNLINWDNPDDPIKNIVIPQLGELNEFGDLDASNEESNYVAQGCQHKYADTALLLVTEICGAYCRYCFRKRLFMQDNDEASVDVTPGIDYIRQTPQISNVLLTGGDPLFLSTRRLTNIISRLREIPHVKIIRLGSKMPAFNPRRITDDQDLLDMLAKYSTPAGRIYIMTHFDVAQELSPEALDAIDRLMKAGLVLANQTPVLKGINHKPEVLAELMRKLSWAGVAPYYFFQCRPTKGNLPYELPLVDAYRALEKAKTMVSGLAKRARLVMSHESGKIEMVGLNRRHIYLRYHQARHAADEGRFMTCQRDDKAFWFDDLKLIQSPARAEETFGTGDHLELGLD